MREEGLTTPNAPLARGAQLPSRRFALLAKGFRPFFLLSAAFAVVAVPVWLASFLGVLRLSGYAPPMVWHVHEMLFGFTAAVIAGFLLTAVSNWTSRETAVDVRLLALVLLWAVGRVLMIVPNAPTAVVALVEGAFLPALALAIAWPIASTENRRNYVMVAVVGALALANGVFHLSSLGVIGDHRHRALIVALDLVVLLMILIAGRVIPMFTRNATGDAAIVSSPRWDVAAALAMALLTALDALAEEATVRDGAAGATAIVALVRARRWGTGKTLRVPLLWILHLGYAWIPIGLGLRGLSALPGLSLAPSIWMHALTAGAIGALTLGMMARVSLGHTGRTLEPPRAVVIGFVAISVAAAARVLGPMLAPAHYREALLVAAFAFSLAFATFVGAYAAMLVAPRIDGKPG